MAEKLRYKFSLIRYVPDVVRGEFVNIGVLLAEVEGEERTMLRLTREWSRVRCMHPDVDVDLLQRLESSIQQQVERGGQQASGSRNVVDVLQDTLANNLQMTDFAGLLADSFDAAMNSLLRSYVKRAKPPGRKRSVGNRAMLLDAMRTAFDDVGVWGLMRKRIAASQYTQAGDSLKLDCGYRNGQVRLFHAVSLVGDLEGAKSLAYSAPALRRGVERAEGVPLELTAVVETAERVQDMAQYEFGLKALEREAVRIVTSSDLPSAALRAKQEMRL